MIDDSEPAFPVIVREERSEQIITQYAGVSTRDYFAAHAPDVPDWFMATSTIGQKIVTDGGVSRMCNVTVHETPLAHLVRWRRTYAAAMVTP